MRYFDPVPAQFQPSFQRGGVIIYDTKDDWMMNLFFGAISILNLQGWEIKKSDAPSAEGLGWIVVEVDDRSNYEQLQFDFVEAIKEVENRSNLKSK